jgi:two-component system sensor histidine kinase MprB
VSLRARIAIAAATAVAVAVALTSATTFVAEHADLDRQIDAALRERADEVAEELFAAPDPEHAVIEPPAFGGAGGYAQVITAADVRHLSDDDGPYLPVSEAARQVATSGAASLTEDVILGGVHVRMYTTPIGQGRALQVARPMDEWDGQLLRHGILLIALSATGVVVAAALGFLVARTSIAPIRRLTDTAERVAGTTDLRERITVAGHDELARLASSFNTMMEALDRSVKAQRQLVADASHELGTPLTSIRTNVEVLARRPDLETSARRAILEDVRAEVEGLAAIVHDIVDMARGDARPVSLQDIRIDVVVGRVVDRARGRSTDAPISLSTAPAGIRADPADLERAIENLIDNALKWSPPGSPVEVTLEPRRLEVRDHGAGIDPADLPYVFDRFYRGSSARSVQGSGLGLAIVSQVATRHGWVVRAENAPEGGAVMTIEFGASWTDVTDARDGLRADGEALDRITRPMPG